MKNIYLKVKRVFPFVLLMLCGLFAGIKSGAQIFSYTNTTASIPSGWTLTNNVATNAVDQGSYLLVDAGSPSDYILSAVYDMTPYTSPVINVQVATFGSGGNNSLKIEVSTNGGSTWSPTTFTTATPTSSSYITGGPISITQTMTNQVQFRFSNNGTTGRGVRIQSLNLTATSVNPIFAITGTLSHGSVCPSVSASPITYTINNTGTAASNVVVSSSDPQFVVSGAPTSIAAGGSGNFNVTFTPSSAGAKSATITAYYNTSTAGATASLTGTGTSTVAGAVTTNAASPVVNTTATLNGNITTLGTCPNTIEKGFVYSVTSTNGNPVAGGGGVTKTSVAGLTTGAFTLGLTGLTVNTGYSYKAYIYDGTTYTYGAVQTFTTLLAASKLGFGTAPPSTGSVNTNLTTFTVLAQRPDNSTDAEYTANVTISKVSGSGNLGGTVTVAAVAGVATFSAAQFDAVGTYTINASSGALTGAPTSGNIVISLANSTVVPWIDAGAANAWHTAANWNPGVPSGAVVAQWNNTGSAVNCGINIGTGAPSILGIEITSLRTRVLAIGGSGSTSGALTLNGGTINSITNVILRNASSFDLTLQPNVSNSSVMSVALGNTTDNAINIDGSGGIIISSVITGGGSNPLSKGGSGSGILQLTGQSSYTGTTTINSGTLQLNRTGGTTIPVTNTVNVNNSGTLQVSQNQTLANVTLASGSTLIVDAGKTLTISGTLTVNVGATISGTGTIAYSGTGSLVYNGTGSKTTGLEWPATTNIPIGVNIGSTATITLSANHDRSSGTTLTVDGILDAVTYSIAGNGTMNINGTLKTANTAGITGSGSTFTGGSFTLNLGASSVVDYNAASGTQVISTSPSYANLTMSNGGTRTAASGLNISNNLTISGTVLFDATGTIGGATTNLIMNNTAKYRINGGGGSTKPDAGGTYTLATTSTIDFANTGGSQVNIRIAPSYANIDISGTNAGLSGTTSTLTLQSGTTFTVKTGGIFNVRNTNGFSGAANTAVNTVPTVTLETNSTVNYDGTGAQAITNAQAYQNLSITAATGTKTAPSGTLTINGNFSKTGAAAFAHNNGTVAFTGTSAQGITSVSTLDFFNLTDGNTSSGLTVYNDINVYKKLDFSGSAKLSLDAGNINIKSGATQTADIGNTAAVTISYPGAGRFIVEKYIATPRKWQFLSTDATVATQSFKDSWMESQTPGTGTSTGYGMWITGPNVVPNFDANTAATSVKWWNGVDYTSISSVNDDIHAHNAYMVYVRGDRGSTGTNGINSTTVLRSKGTIHTGSYPATAVSLPAFNSEISMANPYASAVDLRLINTGAPGSTALTIYVWDPKLTGTLGLGGYQTLTGSQSAGFTISPGGGSYGLAQNDPMNILESGQSFFIQGAATNLQLQFVEGAKDVYQHTVSFTGSNPQFLGGQLFIRNGTDNPLTDGFGVKFDNSYNNSADASDASKKQNGNENVSVKKDGRLMAVELRKPAASTDTIFVNISNMRPMNYRWTVNTQNMDEPGRTAFLVDKYTGTETPLNLTGSTDYDFSVTGAAASFAADRFMVVFKPAVVLAVKLNHISATRTDAVSASVKWTAENEINVHHYELEKSADGSNFSFLSNQTAQNNNSSADYSYADSKAGRSVVYYRVRAINNNGSVQYSPVVKVSSVNDAAGIVVSPNPVPDKLIRFTMNGQLQGTYTVQLLNTAGGLLLSKSIAVSGDSQQIILPAGNVAEGTYLLNVISPEGKINTQKIIIR